MEKENCQVKSTKRILIVSDFSFISGAQKILLSFSDFLKDKYKLFFLLILNENEKSNFYPLLEAMKQKGIKSCYYFFRENNYVFNYKDRKLFPRFIQEKNIKADVVIFNSPASAATFAPILKDKIKVYWSHSYRSRFKMAFISYWCDWVLMVSPLMNRFFPFSKNRVIYPFVTLEGNNGEKSGFFPEIQLNPHDFLVGSIGRIHPQKKWEEIIYLALNTPSNVKFFHVGGKFYHRGGYREKINNLIEKYNLRKRIYFLGHQKNIASFIEKMDLIFHPSRNESLGLAPLEGMLLKKPVLLYQYKYFPYHIFRSGENCLVYRNRKDLLKKFFYLYKNSFFREKISIQANKFVTSFFSKENFFQKMSQIFSEILA